MRAVWKRTAAGTHQYDKAPTELQGVGPNGSQVPDRGQLIRNKMNNGGSYRVITILDLKIVLTTLLQLGVIPNYI